MADIFKVPKSFLKGPKSPEFWLLAKKEVARLMVAYADDPEGLQMVCDYRQHLYDCTLTAQESLEKQWDDRKKLPVIKEVP